MLNINLFLCSRQMLRTNQVGYFGNNDECDSIYTRIWHLSCSSNLHFFNHLLEPLRSFNLHRFVLALWNQQFMPRPQELPNIFCTVDLGLLLGCRNGHCCYDLLHQRLGLHCGMKSFVWWRDFQLTINGGSKPKRVPCGLTRSVNWSLTSKSWIDNLINLLLLRNFRALADWWSFWKSETQRLWVQPLKLWQRSGDFCRP